MAVLFYVLYKNLHHLQSLSLLTQTNWILGLKGIFSFLSQKHQFLTAPQENIENICERNGAQPQISEIKGAGELDMD